MRWTCKIVFFRISLVVFTLFMPSLCHSYDWHHYILGNMGGAIVQVDSQDIRYFLYSQYGSMHLDSYDGSEWHYETISESGCCFACAWLVLDEQDSPHVALTEKNYDDLMYGYKQGSEWVFEIVDDEDEIMSSKSLALDFNGYPHIAYEHENLSTSSSELKYAYKDAYGWHLQVVDDEYHSQGTRCRLDLDSQDHAHITYFKKETGEPGYISYAYWDGTGWQIEPIVLPHTSEFNSLTVDSLDRPHVAFLDGGYLRYAYKDGTDWVIEDIDDDCLGAVSIVLDSQEYPTIAYCAFNPYYTCSIYYALWNGSQWEIEEACTDYEVLLGQLCVFHDLDSEDNPHIAFDESPDVEAWYAWYGDPLTDITLDHFSAQAEGSTIALEWRVDTTESEQIAGFNLYRREINNNIAAEVSNLGCIWTKVNTGLITGENPYTYTDSDVVAGVAYEYKLEAVLADEGAETLGTTQATAGQPTSFAILALYPNPASDYLTCLLAMPEAGVVELSLYDLSGRLVLKQRLEATEPTELEATLDVSGLASGVYTLRASSGGAEVSPACGGVAVVVR